MYLYAWLEDLRLSCFVHVYNFSPLSWFLPFSFIQFIQKYTRIWEIFLIIPKEYLCSPRNESYFFDYDNDKIFCCIQFFIHSWMFQIFAVCSLQVHVFLITYFLVDFVKKICILIVHRFQQIASQIYELVHIGVDLKG